MSLSKTLTLPNPMYKLCDSTQLDTDSTQLDKPIHPALLDSPTITIPNNYTAAIRYGIFRELSKDLAMRMRRPYDDATPLLLRWQYDVIKKMGKRTVFVHVRRAGKSVLMTFL